MSIRTYNIKRFWHSSEQQYTPQQIEKFVKNYGTGILVGGDPGWGDDFEQAMEACDEHHVYKHVYLTGPGMMEWSQEERDLIKMMARSVGINTSDQDWQDQWYKQGGWEKKVHEWFKQYNDFYSAEIDNLDGVWDQDPEQYLQFLKRFGKWRLDNKIDVKLMVKNLSEEQLEAMIDDCEWDRDMVAQFGMFEKGSGSPKRQIELCRKLDIVAVTPINGLRDTNHYSTILEGIPSFS